MTSKLVSALALLTLALHASTQAQAPSQSQTTVVKKSLHGKLIKSIVYINRDYGFRFYLPPSWKGFSVLVEPRSGELYVKGQEESKPEYYEFIAIEHPRSTEANPRQDIPIMVFTHEQWRLVEEGTLEVSAAPIGPVELGRNREYVFALPPRYNYAFETGYEEVEKILERDSLKPFEIDTPRKTPKR